MKKITVSIFVFIALFGISASVSAQLYTPPLGSQSNPLQIQIVETPQSLTNWLKSTYGASAYSDCSVDLMDSSSCSLEFDHLYNQMACPRAIQYCLENPSVKAQLDKEMYDGLCKDKFGQAYQYNTSTKNCSRCQAEYVYDSAEKICRPLSQSNQICQEKWMARWDGKGCQCSSDYAWNEGEQKCVASTTTQSIVFGCTSNTGFSTTSGLPCDGTKKCSSDMQLNTTKTECIPKNKKQEDLTKTKDQNCSQFNAVWSNEKQYCVCNPGYDWSNSKCVAVVSINTPPTPPQKSGWFKRFINWVW